jgi:glycosyltransferase involved in cell wall biosynthesis
MPPLLSIITPVFNGAATIEECIASVAPAAAALGCIEHLILDGASSDGTAERVRALLPSQPHLRLWSEADGGQCQAINAGIRRSQGRFLGHLNADDLYAPGALETACRLLAGCDDATILVGNLSLQAADGTVIYTSRRQWFGLYRLLLGEMPLNPLSYFYPRAIHARIGPLDEADPYAHDLDLLIRLAHHLQPRYTTTNFGTFRLLEHSKTQQAIAAGQLERHKRAVIDRHRAALGRRGRLLLQGRRVANKLRGLRQRLQGAA